MKFTSLAVMMLAGVGSGASPDTNNSSNSNAQEDFLGTTAVVTTDDRGSDTLV